MSADRPQGLPSADHPLLLAARYLDAHAEEHGFTATLDSLRLDADVVTHVAEQRALRFVLIKAGRVEEARSAKYGVPSLSPAQQIELESVVPVAFDGICIGAKAVELERRK